MFQIDRCRLDLAVPWLMFQIDRYRLNLAVAGLVSYRASWQWHHPTFQAPGHSIASLFSVLPLDGAETQKRTIIEVVLLTLWTGNEIL
jgi:hypothetical protein